ncbi:hypothetical protein [Sphingomonas immobilis]|uniref:Uncharacterized protein n=1 Tax=Sphingomonas immobilis TaxID=3063997 RepID=A0ABT8ZVH6_9SPHN|nr:hypothetical protein [Sphingomonas sp. CA1-15]MDO7841587.1 hypothetical protein [Sphingomonas sp. CA1-15]
MNAPVSSLQFVETDAFAAATSAFNEWRGRCIASFASAEAAASEALLALVKQGRPIKPPPPVGARYDLLAAALEGVEGAAPALAALAAFRKRDTLRHFLTHGAARIALDRKGRWLAVLTMIELGGGNSDRRILVVDQDDIAARARDLHADMQRLVAHLRRFFGTA